MLLVRSAALVLVGLVAVRANPYGAFGPLTPLETHGGLYGLGLDGEMSYGHPYPLQRPEYIAGPPKRGSFGRPLSARGAADAKQPQPFQRAGSGYLHDFHTGPFIDHYRGVDGYRLPGPRHLGRPIDVNVYPIPPGGVDRIDPAYQTHPRRDAGLHAVPHGGFRTPLHKDVDVPNAVHEEGLGKEARAERPALTQGLGRPFFNRGPILTRPQQHFEGPYGNKGSFGVGSPPAYGDIAANRISSGYLTPISRYSDGYAYHRVPLALVDGGFVGHYYGTPVVHGIVKAGVPVSLIRGW